ncbi:hypothetical protein ILUMI_12153 [Ignelater luminosus]|uniref:ADP/ATP translocase n=1 Tax=Ignelater luminosus TaxID=2038154 RepID=A0A8K0CYR0_IGNLU|nr:hypothetical protein ILUMI_12153 [Ignelater luminosus]
MLDIIDSDGELQTFVLNFVITGVTSSFVKSLAAPIDRMKLILQNQRSALQILNGQRREYKGFLDCLIRLPKEQGFRSFWRGNGTNLLRYIPTQALNFSFNDFFKHYFHKLLGDTGPSPSPLLAYLSGGCAGACVTFTLYPLKFCQTRLSVDMGSGKCRKQLIRIH